MLGWVNKKLKMTLFKAELRHQGCDDIYPDNMLREIVDATFEMTKEMSRSPLTNSSFDFDGNWNWFILPYTHLLFANAAIGKMRGSMTDEQIKEAFARTGTEQYTNIHPATGRYVEDMLERYGFQNHISAILPLLTSNS